MLKKVFSKIKEKLYLLKHPLYTLMYCCILLFKNASIRIHFYSNSDIGALLKEGKTIIRLGDGDIVNILLGMVNAYHRDDKNLRRMYQEIIGSYTKDSNYILSVPRFIAMSNADLAKLGEGKRNWGARIKAMFLLRFNKNCGYMDAHSFYYEDFFSTVIEPIFLDKKVLCLTNKKVIEEQQKNKNIPWNDITYIETPEHNAMDAYDSLLQTLDEEIKKYDKKNVVIFSAMGPVGKYILFKYAKLGYQGIDIGRGFEVLYKNESLIDIYPELRVSKAQTQ